MPALLLLLVCPLLLVAQSYETIAGGGPATSSNAINASLSFTQAVALGPRGVLYFSSQSRVFRLEADGKLTLIAGGSKAGFSGDGGLAVEAQLRTPYGLAVDGAGNVYISDYGNHRIRRVNPDGIMETIAGNGGAGFSGDGLAAVEAQLRNPCGLRLDRQGNLYIADSGNHRIRKLTPDGVIQTVVGYEYGGYGGDDGQAVEAQIYFPTDVVFDSSGNLYIADSGNHRIRKVDTSGKITTFAGRGNAGFEGDGSAAKNALFATPVALAIDTSNNLYISDYSNHRIRRITSGGVISTYSGKNSIGFSGDNAAANAAELNYPLGIAIDASNLLYLADSANQRIRRVTSSGTISSIAGNGAFQFGGDGGTAILAQMNQPSAAVYDSAGFLYVADTANQRIRVVSAEGTIRTAAGNGTASTAQLSYPSSLAADAFGNVFIADTGNDRIRQMSPDGTVTSIPISPALRAPAGLATDAEGNLYIADTGNHTVLRRLRSGEVQTLIPASAGLNAPYGLALDAAGNLYIADLYNQRVVKRDPAGNLSIAVQPVANSFPVGVLTDAKGNLYVTYYGRHELIRVDAQGVVTKLLGPGELYFPQGMSLNAAGEVIVSDSGNNRVIRLKP